MKSCYPSGALLSSTNSHTHTAIGIQFLYFIEILQKINQLIVPYYKLQLNFIEETTGCRSMMFHQPYISLLINSQQRTTPEHGYDSIKEMASQDNHDPQSISA
jgi:hypothetical protein